MPKSKDTYDIILDDIQLLIRNLLGTGDLINPKFSSKHCTDLKICSNCSSGIIKNTSYVRLFLEEYNNNNYLFLLPDRSMIQCNYEFSLVNKTKKVRKVNLVFLPNPNGKMEEFDYLINDLEEDIEIIQELYSDSLANEYLNDFKYSSNYIRLDYTDAPDDHTEFLHARCHAHIGLNNNFRIPINRVPLLSEFVDLVLYLNYPELWEKHVSTESSQVTMKDICKRKNSIIVSTIEKVLTEGELNNYHIVI